MAARDALNVKDLGSIPGCPAYGPVVWKFAYEALNLKDKERYLAGPLNDDILWCRSCTSEFESEGQGALPCRIA